MDDRPLSPKLSLREKQIARLIHAGFSSYEMRSLLELDVQTLRNYAYTLSKKLEVHSRARITLMVELNWKWFLFVENAKSWPENRKETCMKRPERPVDSLDELKAE